MMREIQQLREIADHCRKGNPLDPSLAQWLGSCLEDFLSKSAGRLDEAFGIRAGRGGVPWRMEYAMRVRDAALRALDRQMDASLSLRVRVRSIHQITVRYAASAWCIDKMRPEMPAGYAGTIKEQLWIAFRSGAPMPIGERRLYQIIA